MAATDLKNIMSSNSEKLNIEFFKKNYFNFLVKLTNIGVNNMSIKSDLNTKLTNLENDVKLDLSNEERKDVLLKIIQSQNNFNNCQEIFTSLVQEFGQYNFLGHCEDCGDYITTHILEIK